MSNAYPTLFQINAAMGGLGWSNKQLARASGMSVDGINVICRGESHPTESTRAKLRHALEAAGIEFTEQEGVRLKSTDDLLFRGPEQFDDFREFVYQQIKRHGGDVSLYVTDERLFSKYAKNTPEYYKKMQALSDDGVLKSFRILAHKSNFARQYTYNTYRWQPEPGNGETAFYVFADCLALMTFHDQDAPYVKVMRSKPLADAYRSNFEALWANGKEPPT